MARYGPARALVLTNFQDYGEAPRLDVETIDYSEDQIIGDWLPERQ